MLVVGSLSIWVSCLFSAVYLNGLPCRLWECIYFERFESNGEMTAHSMLGSAYPDRFGNVF